MICNCGRKVSYITKNLFHCKNCGNIIRIHITTDILINCIYNINNKLYAEVSPSDEYFGGELRLTELNNVIDKNSEIYNKLYEKYTCKYKD